MEFLGKGREVSGNGQAEECLYRGLACGDLPAAWLTVRLLMERRKTETLSYATGFNCGLCLYQMGEYEKALGELKLAEQSLGNPSDFELTERKRFIQVLSDGGNGVGLLPLDPNGGKHLERYGLIRIKWLTALCLLKLGRQQEAASIVRFLGQYQMELS
ncbi:hypothetical protein D3Z55_15005 [Clostridiaceae bacterium]|nr:hypothetical protein [Lachnospiraceae bacterium]NBH18725.1 hypothetical protein [Clostridiaceae bacterium]